MLLPLLCTGLAVSGLLTTDGCSLRGSIQPGSEASAATAGDTGTGGKTVNSTGDAVGTNNGGDRGVTTTGGGDPGTAKTAGDPATTTTGGDPATTSTGGDPATTTTGGDPATTNTGGDPATTNTGGDPATTTTGGDPATTNTGGDPGPALPTGTPDTNEVLFNETVPYQTLDGVGAAAYAFPIVNDMGWDWNAVSPVFDELDLHYIRLDSWFQYWEPQNDNNDPTVVNWSGFGTTNAITAWHDVPFAQFLTAHNIELDLGVWDVANWLASGNPRTIAPSMYPELGESIATYLQNMINNGVPQTVTEVQNEPAIQAQIQYPNPQALRDAALAVLDRLDALGLTNVKLHGPNFHTPTGAADWAAVWLANPRLAARTAAVSYHTWWSNSFADYDSIRQIAEAYGKPVWATEVGYCPLPSGCWGGTHTLQPSTWGTAWDYAMSFYRAIAWSHASRVYQWTIIGFDAAVSPTGQRYPSFYILKQFANFIPPGAQFLDSASGDSNVLALPFSRPDGDYSVILLNTATSPQTIQLDSTRGNTLSFVSGRSTADQSFDQAVRATPNGAGLQIDLPTQSVTSVVVSER